MAVYFFYVFMMSLIIESKEFNDFNCTTICLKHCEYSQDCIESCELYAHPSQNYQKAYIDGEIKWESEWFNVHPISCKDSVLYSLSIANTESRGEGLYVTQFWDYVFEFSNANQVWCKGEGTVDNQCGFSYDTIEYWCPNDAQTCFDSLYCHNMTSIYPFQYAFGACQCEEGLGYLEYFNSLPGTNYSQAIITRFDRTYNLDRHCATYEAQTTPTISPSMKPTEPNGSEKCTIFSLIFILSLLLL